MLRMEKLDAIMSKWKHQTWKKAGERIREVTPLLAGCTTFITEHTEPLPHDSDIPAGLRCFAFDGAQDPSLLSSTARELDRLFADLTRYNAALNVPEVKIIEDDGKTFWPSWRLAKAAHQSEWYMPVNTQSVMTLLKANHFDSILKLFKHHYDHILTSIYTARKTDTLSYQELEHHINQNSTMQFLKYRPNDGMNQHIDNLLRSDATVITIGVGRDVVYDMSPVLHRHHKMRGQIARVTLPEGSAVVMNGDVRYHWTHGVPKTQDKSTKYTMIWMLHHTDEMIKNHVEVCDFTCILGCKTYALRFS